jgi:carboxylate-amine ligase
MEMLAFKSSADFSMGLELELQIINPSSFNLASKAKALLKSAKQTWYESRIKPELTQSMIEINTSIHLSSQLLLKELHDICAFLTEESKKFNVHFCGGGTHPFQRWIFRKIFPTPRYEELSRRYKYIAKRSTVFGLHLHIGCSTTENALYLTHILHRFIPQFIAISGASPFYEGIDTGYHSTRSTIFNNYPLCGTIPYLTDWEMFSAYYHKMKTLEVIESMKDFYWDIRPKPEFGTVEIRVCDTPLTLNKAIMIAAYIQSLACYLIKEKPLPVSPEVYVLYNYNKFQAVRYGLDTFIIDPYTQQKKDLVEDILDTMDLISPFAESLGNKEFIAQLKSAVVQKRNDAISLLEIYDRTGSLKEVVREQCKLFAPTTDFIA